jgi:hypothetical protein
VLNKSTFALETRVRKAPSEARKGDNMKETMERGTILVEEGTLLPDSLLVSTKPYEAGWSSVENFTRGQLGAGLEAAQWTFFYMADEIRVTAFGFDEPSRMRRAARKVIQAVKLQHCNCLELTQVRRKSFCGIPSITIVAHARQIQRSRCFHDGLGPLASASVRSRKWDF